MIPAVLYKKVMSFTLSDECNDIFYTFFPWQCALRHIKRMQPSDFMTSVGPAGFQFCFVKFADDTRKINSLSLSQLSRRLRSL